MILEATLCAQLLLNCALVNVENDATVELQTTDDRTYEVSISVRDITPPPPIEGSPLQILADSMQPGEWAELETNNFDSSTMYVDRWLDGKSMHIAGWTDDAQWDSANHKLLFMGFRQATKFLQYDENLNEWSTLPVFDWPFDQASGNYGHVYGDNAYDGANYYHWASSTTAVYQYDGVVWSQLPLLDMYTDFGTSLEYSPELGLMAFSRKGTYRFIDGQWVAFATDLTVDNYHALTRYHPVNSETLLIEDTTVNLIDSSGVVSVKADAPVSVSINNDKLLPFGTDYLLFVNVGLENTLYHYNSLTDTWTQDTLYTDPHTKYEKPITAYVPEYGVILFIDKKVRLYKPRNL